MKVVKLKAYVGGNFGDDLFLYIICNRYPDVHFTISGKSRLKPIYNKIANLSYISYDTRGYRVIAKLVRLIDAIVNKIAGREVVKVMATDCYVENLLSKRADYNVYITGSGFMNNPEEYVTLSAKYQEELIYYKRHPYLIGCNFGPFFHKKFWKMYTKLFSYASDICFRDSYSKSLFPELENVRYEADVVFSYPKELLNLREVEENEGYLLISVANIKKDLDQASYYYEDYINALRRVIKARNERGEKTILVGFSKEQLDHKTAEEILHGFQNDQLNQVICYPEVCVENVLNLFCNAQAIIATRYHAMILAFLCQRKVCTICYNEKTTHVMEDIDRRAPVVTLDELKQLSADQFENEKMYILSEERRSQLIASSHLQFKKLDKVLMGANYERSNRGKCDYPGL